MLRSDWVYELLGFVYRYQNVVENLSLMHLDSLSIKTWKKYVILV